MVASLRCLVLNQNYEPISITHIKRALCLLYLGKAEIIEPYPYKINSASRSFVVPSVLRLRYFIKVARPVLPLTRHNILKRDNYTCQYCGNHGAPMTADHVIPKKLGGQDTWENLVCACMKCNNLKGDRTPEAVGMKLLRVPKCPHFFFIVNKLVALPDKKWKQYLFIEE